MTVSFFCVMNAANETTSAMEDYIEELGGPTVPENTEDQKSFCYFNVSRYSKTRPIDSFTVDYMYEQN
jgi:hypothetical protein